MDQGLRDRIIKTAIYALVKPANDGGFHLHSFLRNNSNRAEHQDSQHDVIVACAITEAWIAYTSAETPEERIYEEVEA